jgi:hypothetical protein
MVAPARNVFHQRLDLIRQGQGSVVETVSRLETALFQVASGVGDVRATLEIGQKDLASSLGALREEIVNSRPDPQWQQDIATILDRVSRGVPAWGSGAALLCVSVDVDGTFSQASVLGRMVAKTVAVDGVEPKNVGLEHVVSLDREDYAHAAAKIAEAEGFDLTAEDFRHFHMLAEELLARLRTMPKRKRRSGGEASAPSADKDGDAKAQS